MAFNTETSSQLAWPQRQFSERGGQVIWPILVVFLYSTIQLIRIGAHRNHYVFMVVGSVLSVVGLLAYIFASYTHGATGKKSYLGMLMALSGFMPFLFGCYLIAYQGFWGYKELSHGFSVWLIIKAVVAILLGYKIVYELDKLTQLAKSVKPDTDNKSQAEQLDDLLATHSNFGNAISVSNADEERTVIEQIDIDGILEFKKNQRQTFKNKTYDIAHFTNTVTNQERTLFFDISNEEDAPQ